MTAASPGADPGRLWPNQALYDAVGAAPGRAASLLPILNDRFARGEIARQEFEEKRAMLASVPR